MANDCYAVSPVLVEGVDYELDRINGLIKFLSTGALGPNVYDFYSYGGCGAMVEFCTTVPCDQETPLVEGVDFQTDLENGQVKFLSTGALYDAGLSPYVCGARLNACCADVACLTSEDFACDRACYARIGYDTVFQEGAEMYRSGDEKMIKRVMVEAEPLPDATPNDLECDVGYAPTPNCFTWQTTRPLLFECQTELTVAERAARKIRPDGTFNYPTWRRGMYISCRFRLRGIGGGGTFSALHRVIKGWGQPDSP